MSRFSSPQAGIPHGWKAQEANAKARRERNKEDPEVRAARSRLLEEREARMAGQQAAVETEKRDRPGAVQAVLAHATLDELQELVRAVGQLDGRRMADLVNDEIRTRTRTAYKPPQEPQEAPPAPEASSARRSSRRA